MKDNLSATLLVAKESFTHMWEGVPRDFKAGETRVRAGHPMLKGVEHLFEPIKAHYEYESATQAPGEKRGAPAPAPKDAAA